MSWKIKGRIGNEKVTVELGDDGSFSVLPNWNLILEARLRELDGTSLDLTPTGPSVTGTARPSSSDAFFYTVKRAFDSLDSVEGDRPEIESVPNRLY